MDSIHDCDMVPSTPPRRVTVRVNPALYHAGFRHDPDVSTLLYDGRPGARVLVVDAYGGAETALAWLARAPRSVDVAAFVDASGVGMVLALEVEAAACLDRLEMLRLLGLLRASRSERVEMYLRLREALSPETRGFWDRHRSALAGGIYNTCAEATLGRLLRNLLSTNLSSDSYRTLLYGAREERLALFDERIAHSPFWHSALRLCAVRGRVAAPQDRAVDAFSAGDPVKALRRMVDVGLWSSPLWARAFCNDTGVLATLPAHFRPEGFEVLQAHLDRLSLDVADVDTAIARAVAPYDAVDLGNLPDYLSDASFADLLARLAGQVAHGGRVTWTGIVRTADAVSLPDVFCGAPDLEARADAFDRAPLHGRRRIVVRR